MYLKIKKVEKDIDIFTGEILGFNVLISYRRQNETRYRWYESWFDQYGDLLVDFNGIYRQDDDEYLLARAEQIIPEILAVL